MDILLLVLLGVVTLALIVYLAKAKASQPSEEEQVAEQRADDSRHSPSVACCGAHEICEAETLLTLTDKVIYYDDEELDAYRGRQSSDYTGEETDEFREVLLTLQPHEVSGWLRSLGLRGVTPPEPIREEALMIVSEFRDARMQAAESKHI